MAKERDIRAVILDVDGTLVDSNDAHARAWMKALERGGHPVPYDKVRRLIGMGSDNLLPEAAGVEKETAEGKQMSEWWKESFKEEYISDLKAFPRTRELLQELRDRGLRLVVASSAEEDLLKQLLDIAGASDLIEEKTSADDAKNSKPDPDIVAAALKQLALDPDQVVMLGDTPYDVEAALRAGIDIIGVRSGGWDDEGLEGAIAVYDDVADLLEQLDSSPLSGVRV